jgi:hypothetical protein
MTMPRDGAIIFSDLIGKLDVLRIGCLKCGRAGGYKLPLLVAQYGRNEKLFTFIDEIAADCPRKQRLSDYDPCAVRCPDLPKVV